MRTITRAILAYLRHAAGFLLASSGIAALFTFALPFVGYATYGDRPGPGWLGLPAGVTWDDVTQLAGMAFTLPAFGAIPVLLYFLVPYAIVRGVERTAARPLIVRVLATLLCLPVAWLVIAGAGWYISLGFVAASAGILGGGLYGACVLPRRDAPPAAAVA